MLDLKAPKEYRTRGFDHRLVKESNHAIIFSKIDIAGNVSYEIFKRKIRKPYSINGELFDARIRLPGDEDFGKWAWASYSFEGAISRFNKIENREL